MMRKGAHWAIAYAKAQHGCANGGCRVATSGARAWLSGVPGGENDSNEDATPAETKLAFASTVYGKDPASGIVPTAAEAAAVDILKRAATAKPSGLPASKSHDPRAMFDSALSQQAEDGKASGGIKRDVATDTPDATRVAFRATAYGKDGQAAAELSAEEAAEVGALRSRAPGSAAGYAAAAAAPVHDGRNMFDSDLTHSAGDTPASHTIKRDVAADTPDATRVAFRASAYGKDPQAAAALSAQEAADVDSLRKSAVARGSGYAADAAPIHDSRNMFDSDLSHGAGTAAASDTIKRDVTADTPDATRVAFRASDYGKDPQAAAALSAQEAAEVDVLLQNAQRGGGDAAAGAAPIHDSRNMFDSDFVHGAGDSEASDAIKREVVADTPEVTRLVFGGSDYGKDPHMKAHTAEKQAELDALAAQTMRQTAEMARSRRSQAPVHHDRSMFDSDLTQGAGAVRESGAIKRNVEADTPALTRLSFFGSTYGDGDGVAEEQMGADAEALAAKQTKGAKLATVGRGARKSKVHDTKKAMADDEYSAAGSE